jgi:hypothetical protein
MDMDVMYNGHNMYVHCTLWYMYYVTTYVVHRVEMSLQRI